MLASGLNPSSVERTNDGSYLIERGLAGAAALARLREMTELVGSTPVGDTLHAFTRTIRLSRDSAAELIQRIDRGDDSWEIMSFAHGSVSDRRSEHVEARRLDEGA